ADNQLQQDDGGETGKRASRQFQVKRLNSQPNRKKKKDHPCERNKTQWKGRKCCYTNQSEIRAPEVRPSPFPSTTWSYFKGNLDGPKPHPSGHSPKEHVTFTHRQPRIEYPAVYELKV